MIRRYHTRTGILYAQNLTDIGLLVWYKGRPEVRLQIVGTFEQLDRWQRGELIQRVFPYLSADEREFLMTGMTAEDWEKAFPPEDDETDEHGETWKEAMDTRAGPDPTDPEYWKDNK